MQTAIANRVAQLRAEIATYAQSIGRDPATIRLCAVSKFQPREAILAVAAAGVHDVGESYVQEAQPKLADLAGLTTHFIGHIQRNKINAIVKTFDVIQSIDRREVGASVAQACLRLGRRVRTLVQVNISPTDRFGVAPSEAVALAAYLRSLDLEVDGLMAIGPHTEDSAQIRRSFEEAARLFSQIGGSTFSIGMSSDWRQAVACGSTMLRIGTALFGPRISVSPPTT